MERGYREKRWVVAQMIFLFVCFVYSGHKSGCDNTARPPKYCPYIFHHFYFKVVPLLSHAGKSSLRRSLFSQIHTVGSVQEKGWGTKERGTEGNWNFATRGTEDQCDRRKVIFTNLNLATHYNVTSEAASF